MSARLQTQNASLGYDGHVICPNTTLEIPDGLFTVILGPNACGKSTLLKSLIRLLPPIEGTILLDAKDIHQRPTREVARELGFLPQGPTAPDSIRVADLVARGRYPHQTLFSPWTKADEEAVAHAMKVTGVSELSARHVDELSGGQRQRVWLAMALAQETNIVLLDEPTTFLDPAHQIEMLELCRQLNRKDGTTLVAVLHDVNQACRYADHIIAMREGTVIAEGDPKAIINAELVEAIYGMPCRVIDDPESHTPLVIPRWTHHESQIRQGTSEATTD